MENPVPALSPWEYELLKESIIELGILIPIVKDQHGNIIDGFHRMAIIEELGLKDYPVEVIEVEDEEERRALAIRLNVERRQLSHDQLNWMRSKQRKTALEARNKGATQAEAAKRAAVTQQAVSKWEKEEEDKKKKAEAKAKGEAKEEEKDGTKTTGSKGTKKRKDQRVIIPPEEHENIWSRCVMFGDLRYRILMRCILFLCICLTGNLKEIEYIHETKIRKPRTSAVCIRPTSRILITISH